MDVYRIKLSLETSKDYYARIFIGTTQRSGEMSEDCTIDDLIRRAKAVASEEIPGAWRVVLVEAISNAYILSY